MTLFLPIREKLFHEELGEYVTYGIKAYQNTNMITNVSDVSTNFFFTLNLCVKFTFLKLSPCHLNDVLSDLL